MQINRKIFETNPGIISDLIHPDDKSIFTLKNELANIKLIPFQWEGRLIINNNIVWSHLESKPRKLENGCVLWTGVLDDITERKQNEEALIESENKYRELVDNSPDAIVIHSNGKIAFANNACLNLIRANSAEELIGKSILNFVHPDYRELAIERIKKARTLGTPLPIIEEKFLKFDGSIIDVDVKTLPIIYKNKQAIQLIVRDITERKKTESEILRNSKKLNALVNILQFPIASVPDYLDYALNQAIEITDSKIGYIYDYSEAKREFILNSWPEGSLSKSKLSENQYVYKSQNMGIFADAVRERKSIVINEFKDNNLFKEDYPVGTVKIDRLLSTPIFNHNEIVGMVVVANKENEYNDSDIKQLVILMEIVWKTLDKHRSDIALQQSEEKFKKAFITSPDAINITRVEDGCYISVNEGFTRMTGYTEDDIIGKTSIEKNIWVNPADREKLVQALKTDGVLENLFARFRKKSGEIIYGLMSARQVFLDGTPNILTITRDITSIRDAEIALRQSEERFKVLFEYAPDVMFLADTETQKIIDANHAACRLFKKEKKELVGLYQYELHPREIIEQAKQFFKIHQGESQKKNTTNPIETVIISSDGMEIPVEILAQSITINNKALLLGTFRNITDRRLAEEALRKSEQKLSTLFGSLTEMVVLHEMIFDECGVPVDYRILECNDIFTQITGISKINAIGRNATEVYQCDEAPYLEEYSRVVLTGKSNEFSTYYAQLDKHFLISAVLIGINQFATITTDITTIQQVKEEIITKNKELENYMYVASHDLRSPLVNIQGFSKRLQKQSDTLVQFIRDQQIINPNIDKIANEDIPKSLNFILSNVSKMDTLINGLLQLSRTGRIVMEINKVDMQKLIKSVLVVNNFQLTEIGAEVLLGDLDDCYGDENQLNQLFSNIIGNAIKYRDTNRSLKIEISSTASFNKIVYCIKDSGIGINERHLAKIWDVFYRVDSSSTEMGEGLGLSLAKKIVDKHKGKIWVESELGIGSEFYIELQKNEFVEL